MRTSKLLPLLLFVFAVLCPSAARAVQVVLLEPQTRGELPPEDRARIGDALWAALDRLGLRRVPDADRDAVLQGEAGLRACLGRDECLERLGHLLEAAHVISVRVERTAPAAHSLSLRFFDVEVGQDDASDQWSCTSCKIDDVGRQLDTMIEAAWRAAERRPRATLVLRSTPPNADVQIDGRKVGFTELERPVFAGEHDVVVSRVGLAPEHLRINLAAGQRLVLALSLTPPTARPLARGAVDARALTQTAVNERPRRSYGGIIAGVPLLVLGLGGVGLGVTSLVLDGSCAATPCTRVYDTRLYGYIEVGAGAVLSALGIGLIAWNAHKLRTEKAQRPLSVGPLAAPGGSGLALRGAF